VKPTDATRWLTDPRFAPYLAEAKGDHAVAVELYVWNARISAAMFETLHHVEVLVPNTIDAQFTSVDAAAAPRDTRLEDASILNDAARRRVIETIGPIRREHKTPTRGRVVAGLSFGFWRALFDRKYDALWVSRLHRAFPHGSGSRGEVAALMSGLVPFRNRLAHHETIIRRPIARHYLHGDPAAAGFLRCAGLLRCRGGGAEASMRHQFLSRTRPRRREGGRRRRSSRAIRVDYERRSQPNPEAVMYPHCPR